MVEPEIEDEAWRLVMEENLSQRETAWRLGIGRALDMRLASVVKLLFFACFLTIGTVYL